MWTLLAPVAAGLLAVLAAAAFALWYARRRGIGLPAQGKDRHLRIVERLILSQRAVLVLVEYDGRPMLIGQSGDRLSLIDRAAIPGKEEHEAS